MQSRLIPTAHRFLLASLWLCTGAAMAAPAHRAILYRIPAEYPEVARRMHIEGVVAVRATIRPDGTVAETHIESGHAMLAPAAKECIEKWRFAPDTQSTDLVIQVGFKYDAH